MKPFPLLLGDGRFLPTSEIRKRVRVISEKHGYHLSALMTMASVDDQAHDLTSLSGLTNLAPGVLPYRILPKDWAPGSNRDLIVHYALEELYPPVVPACFVDMQEVIVAKADKWSDVGLAIEA
jgi:hypothetical protein